MSSTKSSIDYCINYNLSHYKNEFVKIPQIEEIGFFMDIIAFSYMQIYSTRQRVLSIQFSTLVDIILYIICSYCNLLKSIENINKFWHNCKT